MENNKPKIKPRILLLDAWNIMISTNSVVNILDGNASQIGMYLGTLNVIRTLVDKWKPSKIVFAMDGPNAGERRRKIYSGYKNGRGVKAKTSAVFLQEDEDGEYTKYTSQQAFTVQMSLIFDFLKLLPITATIIPYCEGDDIIAYAALKNKDEYDVIICSSDKDYCQLIQEGISVYHLRTKTLFDERTFIESFHILPQNYIFMKILLGDSSDEIKNSNGVGKKTFERFHKVLLDEIYEDVGEFVEAVKEMDMTDWKTREKNVVKALSQEEAVENMFLLYQVMKLDENCLKLHHIEMLRQQVEEQESCGFNRIGSWARLSKHNFNKLYNGFNSDRWLQPFVFVKPNIKIKL